MKIGLAPIRVDKMGGGPVGMLETALVLHDAGHRVWFGYTGKLGPIKERLRRVPFPVCSGVDEIDQACRGTHVLIAPEKRVECLKDMRWPRKIPRVVATMWTMDFGQLKLWEGRAGFPYHAIWVDSRKAGWQLSHVAVFPRYYHQLYSPIPLHPGRFQQEYDVAALKEELGLNTRLVMGNVARHVGSKGIGGMIDLWEHCPEEASLLLIGSGWYHRNFKKQAGKSAQVKFTGYVGDDTPYLACMDIFLHLPLKMRKMSNVGTVALAPSGAMMMGLPVVATKADFGWEEQFEDGVSGYVVDSTEEALERVQQLLRDDALREKMGQSAKTFIEKKNEAWQYNLLSFLQVLGEEL